MPEGRSSPRQDLIADVGKLLQQDSAEATRKLAAAVHDGRPDAQTDEMKHHFPTRRFDRYTQPRSHFGETLFNRRSERTSPASHVLQSATRALKTGMREEIILACLLHDVVNNLIRPDHGWWGAQLVEPYVPEITSFAIRYHQTLRFFPDTEYGYEYPESYFRIFGEDYIPEPYLERTHKWLTNHKWYEHPRLVTVNDLYSFDRSAVVSIDPFVDIIGRHFKQPEEGLGWDNSPTSHMWRTMIWPDRRL